MRDYTREVTVVSAWSEEERRRELIERPWRRAAVVVGDSGSGAPASAHSESMCGCVIAARCSMGSCGPRAPAVATAAATALELATAAMVAPARMSSGPAGAVSESTRRWKRSARHARWWRSRAPWPGSSAGALAAVFCDEQRQERGRKGGASGKGSRGDVGTRTDVGRASAARAWFRRAAQQGAVTAVAGGQDEQWLFEN